MRRGLAPLIIAAAAIVVILVVAGFFATARGFQSVRNATRAEQRAQSAAATATQVEKLVLDLETGTRGYVLTGDERFLQPWRSAQRRLPGEVAELRSKVGGRAPGRVAAMWQGYLDDWSRPVIAQARTDRAAAQETLVQGEGKRRVDAMRSLLDGIVASSTAEAEAAGKRADRAEHNAIVIGLTGTVVRVLIIVVIVGVFLHYAINPLRDMSKAARRVARGERGVTVDERGIGEVRDLAIAFNGAARSLEQSADDLEQQNVDLERLANVLRAVLDSTVDGILLSDAEGNVQLANRPVVNLTRDVGMSYEGRVVDRLLSIEHRMKDQEKYRAAMERLRTNPDEPTFDEFEDTVSGRVFQGFTAPVRDDRGGFIGRVWTLREVTQQRELDRLKDEFVATVSHELRTPLTSMMGFLEMIREGEAGILNDEQKRFLAIVYRSSERLQRLVGDLLFVARLDANGLQLQFTDVRVDDIVRESVESVAALARSREVEVVSQVHEVPPVWGDRERLAQLVGNLLSNALKFTPAGGRMTVRTFTDGRHAVLEVEDTGIGIPKAEQDRLFQRFFRSSTATEQAIPGTGLGLVISKAIAEAHGGTIEVRSEPGEGTCFRVELPLEQEEVAA
jgi:signal transduction histidine kinase/CHASE3 domain sensor protein